MPKGNHQKCLFYLKKPSFVSLCTVLSLPDPGSFFLSIIKDTHIFLSLLPHRLPSCLLSSTPRKILSSASWLSYKMHSYQIGLRNLFYSLDLLSVLHQCNFPTWQTKRFIMSSHLPTSPSKDLLRFITTVITLFHISWYLLDPGWVS